MSYSTTCSNAVYNICGNTNNTTCLPTGTKASFCHNNACWRKLIFTCMCGQ